MKHRYHLNVVFQFTLGYYFFEVIRNELYFWILTKDFCSIVADGRMSQGAKTVGENYKNLC